MFTVALQHATNEITSKNGVRLSFWSKLRQNNRVTMVID